MTSVAGLTNQKFLRDHSLFGANYLKEKLGMPGLNRLRPLAAQDRLLALMCLALAVIIAMPIPFGNLPPAACVLLIALGMIQRDGLFVLAGFAGGLLLLGLGGFLGHAIVM